MKERWRRPSSVANAKSRSSLLAWTARAASAPVKKMINHLQDTAHQLHSVPMQLAAGETSDIYLRSSGNVGRLDRT